LKTFDSGLMNVYSQWRVKLEDFNESEKYFFTDELMSNVSSILDVGCGCGGLGNALKIRFGTAFSYTGINTKETCVIKGEKISPELKIIDGIFPNSIKSGKMFDMICAFGFFHMVLEWKKLLFNLTKFANKFVNVGVVSRLEGATVIDPDVSYYYYLDSGDRVPSIAINIRELLNYCCHHELRVKRIKYYGYHNKSFRSTAFRPIQEKDTIYGNLFLELFEPGNETVPFGGLAPNQTNRRQFVPDLEIIIDGKSWNEWR